VAGAFEEITGYTFDEYIAHGGWRATLHPDDLVVDDRDLETLRSNRPVITEVRTFTKGGDLVWVCVYAHPVWDAARQELVGIYGAVQNITERKQAEEAQRARFERISRHDRALVYLATKGVPLASDFREAARAITQAAGEATGVERVSVWLLCDEGRQLACVDLYELETGRHSGGDILDAARYPNYFEALNASRVVDADDALRDPRTSEFRDHYLTPLGIPSMLDATIRDAGQVVGVVCFEHVGEDRRTWQADELAFAREVADQAALALLNVERRQALEALQQSEEQYRSLVETSGAGVVSIDLEGKLTFVNQGACDLFCYSKEELLGRPFTRPNRRPSFCREAATSGHWRAALPSKSASS
jgi:PAS domain S-box-containing protein